MLEGQETNFQSRKLEHMFQKDTNRGFSFVKLYFVLKKEVETTWEKFRGKLHFPNHHFVVRKIFVFQKIIYEAILLISYPYHQQIIMLNE